MRPSADPTRNLSNHPSADDAAVIVTRGDGVEAWHRVAAVVVDGEGQVTHSLGDPELVTFARSSIKPLQALPLVLSGALEALGFGDEELALAASSHNGTDRHRAIAERMLGALGLNAQALQCGTHWPLGLRAAGQYPHAGEDRDPLRHNCSGKHAGFLAVAQTLGAARDSYLAPDSPVQRLVRRAVAATCRCDEATMIAATDGCSAPNFALPLSALARGFMRLATSVTRTDIICAEPNDPDGLPEHLLAGALARVRHAMQAHPELVSGEGRFDCLLHQIFGSGVVAKGGAEALQAMGFAAPAMGIVVKVLDGGERALAPACLAVLDQLGILPDLSRLPDALAAQLEARARPRLTNYRGLETGAIRVVGRLRDHGMRSSPE